MHIKSIRSYTVTFSQIFFQLPSAFVGRHAQLSHRSFEQLSPEGTDAARNCLRLQVKNVSDVSNAAGGDFRGEVRRCHPISCLTTTNPRQPKPSKKDWVAFRDLLQNAEVRLGPWLPTWQLSQPKNTGNCNLKLAIPNR